MVSRWTAFFAWALAAAAAMFWGLKLAAPAPAAPLYTVVAGEALPEGGDLSRLLGSTANPESAAPAVSDPGLSARFQLLGVVAPRSAEASPAAGVALIAIDGKPARPFRPGALLDGELALLSVGKRSASIGPAGGAPALVLELPALPPPATGSLPQMSLGAAAGAAVPVPPAGAVPPPAPDSMPPETAVPPAPLPQPSVQQ